LFNDEVDCRSREFENIPIQEKTRPGKSAYRAENAALGSLRRKTNQKIHRRGIMHIDGSLVLELKLRRRLRFVREELYIAFDGFLGFLALCAGLLD
jgi:hypothetical protein